MNNRGQIAIFVIVAIVLVVGIAIIFSIYRAPILERTEKFSPETFIDKCLREEVREVVNVMLPQGGFVAPTDYKLYQNTQVAYLCKNINYYDSCITQHPLYMKKLESEVEDNIQEQIVSCFLTFEEELDSRNYQHSGGEIEIDVELKPGLVEAVVYRDFSFSKGDFSKSFESFSVAIRSPLYDLGFVANEIASQEAKFCHFSHDGFMLLYPRFDIRKFVFSESTKIYTIKDKETNAEMNIAIRGCAIPAGF